MKALKTRRVARALSWLALLALFGCGGSGPSYPYAREPDPRRSEYVIGVADTLRVRIWRYAELNTDVQVRPDGTITMPLVGDIAAAQHTPSELKREITDRLTAFIKTDESMVAVEVATINSYTVTVTGNVTRPGVMQSSRYLSVGEAITLAGGPNPFANPDQAMIVRTRKSGRVVHIPIRYDLIMQGKAREQDIMLLRGDLVHVP
ncbi:MAG TPA: polysaccharide biosynthesis/export family protein [Polyangiaceae bacterium]|jgi:polysaccharide export outer membrane protein|nr:polysaccharide biosynthesis/export family protein [Polyangiaceae bacterium]